MSVSHSIKICICESSSTLNIGVVHLGPVRNCRNIFLRNVKYVVCIFPSVNLYLQLQ
jgi:hypothetical protein